MKTQLNRLRRTVLVLLLVGGAAPAGAQSVKVAFRDGRVTVHAQNAPVRAILAEWARVGGTQVVNAERLTSGPVTLELVDTPETQALEIILRGLSGYIAGSRADATTSMSLLDRIMIVPTSGPGVAPIPQSAPPPPPPAPFATRRAPDPDDDPVSDVPPNDDPPAPEDDDSQVNPDTPPDMDEPEPDATPDNPFAPRGSTMPGTITPVPPAQEDAPGPPNPDQEP